MFVCSRGNFDIHNLDQFVFFSVYLNNVGKRSLGRNQMIFLEDNDVSNRHICGGVMPFNKVPEDGDVFTRPFLTKMTV